MTDDLQRRLAESVRNPQLMRAALALSQDRLDIAEPLLKNHLKQDPFDVVAMRMLAELAGRIARYTDAETLLRRALELAPGFTSARANLALLLFRANRLDEALAELERLTPADASDHDDRDDHDPLRAAVLGRLGDYDEAVALYQQLIERYSRQPRIHLSYGHMLKTIGRLDDGIAAYRQAITLAPGLGEAWWSLANLKTVHFTDADITAMEQALAANQAADQTNTDQADREDRFHLEFALGKAWEDRGDAARAFPLYHAANQHRRSLIHYDAGLIHTASQRACQAFTQDYFARRPGFGCGAVGPIFIVGLPRSGSTLVEQILASHSAIEAIDELPIIPMLWNRLSDGQEHPHGGGPLAACLALDADAARRLGEEYLARVTPQRRTNRPYFIDKLPNNWRYIGFIKTILPAARIIDVRRHPLSCGFSNFKQHYARGQNFSYDLADIGRYYRDYMMLTDTLATTIPGGLHRVIYEHMVDDTDNEIHMLLTALGLPFEAACLAFHQTRRPVRTPSSEQVRSPIFRQGMANWHAYDAWLGPLRLALGDVLETWDHR